jgi:hypothetical protein
LLGPLAVTATALATARFARNDIGRRGADIG